MVLDENGPQRLLHVTTLSSVGTADCVGSIRRCDLVGEGVSPRGSL